MWTDIGTGRLEVSWLSYLLYTMFLNLNQLFLIKTYQSRMSPIYKIKNPWEPFLPILGDWFKYLSQIHLVHLYWPSRYFMFQIWWTLSLFSLQHYLQSWGKTFSKQPNLSSRTPKTNLAKNNFYCIYLTLLCLYLLW